MKESNCPVCKSDKTEIFASYHTNSPELIGRNKAECKDCNLAFLTPLPSEQDWDDYNSNYFEKAHGGLALSNRARAYHRALAKLRVQHVKKFIEQNNIQIENVFEVGPGNGEFAEYWINLFASNYTALETDAMMHERLSSLGVKLITAAPQTAEHEESHDLVVISHVLEHTLDPSAFLSSMTKSLKSGGVLFIEVPCLDYKYKNEDEPHILFFDKPAMQKLLTDGGFKKITLSYHGERHEKLIANSNPSRPVKILSRLRSELSSRLTNNNKQDPALKDLTQAEWQAIYDFKPHITQQSPARWLRVMAIKQ